MNPDGAKVPFRGQPEWAFSMSNAPKQPFQRPTRPKPSAFFLIMAVMFGLCIPAAIAIFIIVPVGEGMLEGYQIVFGMGLTATIVALTVFCVRAVLKPYMELSKNKVSNPDKTTEGLSGNKV